LLLHLKSLRHVIVHREVNAETRTALEAVQHIEGVHDFYPLLDAQPATFDWPDDPRRELRLPDGCPP